MATEKKRFFTIQGSDIGFEGGRYSTDKSGSPGSAARRAASIIFRMIENKTNNAKWRKYQKWASHKSIKFIIREVTQGSNKDTFYYEAASHPLKTPRVITRDGVEVKITKRIVVKSHIPGSHRGGDEVSNS